MSDDAPAWTSRLTSPVERRTALGSLGIEHLVVIPTRLFVIFRPAVLELRDRHCELASAVLDGPARRRRPRPASGIGCSSSCHQSEPTGSTTSATDTAAIGLGEYVVVSMHGIETVVIRVRCPDVVPRVAEERPDQGPAAIDTEQFEPVAQ